MNREHVVTGLLAALALLALGGAAATLDATAGGGGGSGGAAGPSATGPGAGADFRLPGVNVTLSGGGPDIPRWVSQLLLVLFVVSLVAGTYLFYRDHGVRRLAGVTALLTVAILLGVYLFRLLSSRRGERGPPNPAPDPTTTPGGAAPGQVAQQAPVNDLPTALLVVIGVVLLGAVAVIVRSTGDERVDLAAPEPEPDPGTDPDVSAVAAAAGRAADRIDDAADLENAVYRAWREMTTHLPVENPAASTPAEFADAAVEAGMERDDVAELTRLFEDIRYGDAPVTPEREERAIAALRRIERTYADVSADAVAGPQRGDGSTGDSGDADDPGESGVGGG